MKIIALKRELMYIQFNFDYRIYRETLAMTTIKFVTFISEQLIEFMWVKFILWSLNFLIILIDDWLNLWRTLMAHQILFRAFVVRNFWSCPNFTNWWSNFFLLFLWLVLWLFLLKLNASLNLLLQFCEIKGTEFVFRILLFHFKII